MFRTTSLLMLLCLAHPVVSQVFGPTQDRNPPAGWTDQVRSELAATLIVRGKIHVRERGSLQRAMASRGQYVRMHVRVLEVLKGEHRGNSVPLTFFAAPREHPHKYSPTAESMLSHVGRERVIYLLSYTPHHFFLVDRFRGTAIYPATPRKMDEVRRSVANHVALGKTPPPPNESLVGPISDLLDFAMEGPDQQLRAFMQLERLGPGTIPTLVNFLDDERELPTPALLLQDVWNTPIPALREYRPEIVRDAICTVLHQRTGEQFGLEYSRPQPHQRDRECESWRVYAHYIADDDSFRAVDEAALLATTALTHAESATFDATPPVRPTIEEP